jgi:exopolysaccharide/PEP-CTERM locus tyrosine autokinase
MSLIEQAAKRLDELRRAGVEVPVPPAKPPAVEVVAPRSGPVPPAVPPARTSSVHRDIDLARLANAGFVTPDNPRSRTADEFRIVKRPLIANVAGKGAAHIHHANLIMVTSAMPGEGKTFCSLNLAMSIAMEVDRTVLLVDADVARPSLPQTLGLPEGPGLLDVLGDGSVDLSRAIIRTNVENLSFLPSGRSHPNAAELLASEAMARLLDDIARRYPDRIVIFDSPPLLVTTESRVLASRMGQVLFVVSADKTLQGDVKRAIATIEACPVKMVLLNQATTPSQGTYGYGYGYGE